MHDIYPPRWELIPLKCCPRSIAPITPCAPHLRSFLPPNLNELQQRAAFGIIAAIHVAASIILT